MRNRAAVHPTALRRVTTGVTAPLLVTLLAACGASDTPTAATPWSERDSAGITVVENRLDEIPRGTWSVDPSPLLSIGGMDAPEGQQVFRVAGGTRLPDGRIALASAGTFQVRVYDADGTLLGSFGAEGEGPGEFKDPTLLGRYGADTLVVFDGSLLRVTHVHADQGILGSVPVSWDGKGFAYARGILPDGSIMVGGSMTFSSQEGFPTGPIRPLSAYGWVDRGGTQAVVLGDFPAAEMFARADERGFMALSRPFGRVTVAAASAAGAWLGTGDRWTLTLRGPDGSTLRVVEGSGETRPVTSADRSAYIEDQVSRASSDNDARQTRALMDEIPFPDEYPPYRSMVADAQGGVWVQSYPAPGEDVSTWTVLDALGRGVARLTTPPRTRILEVGADYVLGVTLDEMDVESVTLWGLRRG